MIIQNSREVYAFMWYASNVSLFDSATVKFTNSQELDYVSSDTEITAEPNMHSYSSILNT